MYRYAWMEMYSNLSHITCPVCGKSSFLRNFDPEKMRNNIYVYSVTGLGRGKGYRITARDSILHSPEHLHVRERLAARMIKVLGLLAETGTISKEQIIQGLGLDDVIKAPLAAMDEKNRQQAEKVSELEKQKGDTEAALAQSIEEKKEIEDKMGSAETDVHSMLRHLGLDPLAYHGLKEKLEVLNSALWSLHPPQG
jgi:hypothetical protein